MTRSTRNRVLVVAAHPDDEALGCGGALAAHASRGDEVGCLLMTDGVSSRGAREADCLARTKACEEAMTLLGVEHCKRLDFPDNALDSVPMLEVCKSVELFCEEWGPPSIVYTHSASDLNVDHQITHKAVMTAFRPQPSEPDAPRCILSYEVPSSTGWAGTAGRAFEPNYFQDITSTLPKKIASLRAYHEEMRPWPHYRSIEAVEHLARVRGASIGVPAAEAFVVQRIVER